MQQAVLAGESANFPSWTAHGAWVRRLALRMVADPNEADDVVQEALLTALLHRPKAEAELRPWLAEVTRNVVRKIRRSEARSRRREERAAKEESCWDLTRTIEEAERRDQLESLIADLREPYRSAILLHFYAGQTPAQIAASENLRLAAVYKRIQRGLVALCGSRISRISRRTQKTGQGRGVVALPAFVRGSENQVNQKGVRP